MMQVERIANLFKNELSEEVVSSNLMNLRVLCANEKTEEILEILDNVLKLCRTSSNVKLIVDIYELKIKQLYHSLYNLPIVERLVQKMKQCALEINYTEGIALSFQIEGYLELIKGNRKESGYKIEQAMEILKRSKSSDHYVDNICSYSYAFNRWLIQRDFRFHRSFAQCLSVLTIIYQQTQSKKESAEIAKKIVGKRYFLDKLPNEIKSIVFFCMGFSQELSFELERAEEYLLKAKELLQPIYRSSIYSSYYITTLSYLTATYALRGKLELSWNQIKEVEDLIEEGIVTRNLDNFNKEQMKHIFNLTKFYILSRLQSVVIEDLQELTTEILLNINKYYSNSMFFTEFLLNANLSKKQLTRIKKLNTPSTKRVEHILDFLIAKKSYNKENQIIELVSTLQRRPVEDRMTLEEKAFADLLAAQEYFKLKRYTEIYPLLRKYEKRLDQIEVLELRLFMEAFIQIGAYKNGDLMGPMNQYLAIKKCRLYRLTKLENRLLDYLDVQAKEARTNTNYIYS